MFYSTDWMRRTYIIKSNLLYSKSTDLKLFFFVFVYFERKCEKMCLSGGGAERERERDNPSTLCTVGMEPDEGLEPINWKIMT